MIYVLISMVFLFFITWVYSSVLRKKCTYCGLELPKELDPDYTKSKKVICKQCKRLEVDHNERKYR